MPLGERRGRGGGIRRRDCKMVRLATTRDLESYPWIPSVQIGPIPSMPAGISQRVGEPSSKRKVEGNVTMAHLRIVLTRILGSLRAGFINPRASRRLSELYGSLPATRASPGHQAIRDELHSSLGRRIHEGEE